MPRVSVIIPVYNSQATLAAAVESILAQTYRDFELIAVDDGSTDASREILSRYSDRITILARANAGPAVARNAGVRVATGDLLAFLDSDDLWKPELLAVMVPELDAHRECAMAWCDLELIDSLGRPLGSSLAGKGGDPTLQDLLTKLWPIMPSGAVIPRWAFEAAGGYPESMRKPSFEDLYLFLRLREHGPFRYVQKALGAWRFAEFPKRIKTPGVDPAAVEEFKRLVRERYGVSAAMQIAGRARAPRSLLGYIGINALRAGDRKTARTALARAIMFDPTRIKNYLRLSRTFLPHSLAIGLGGRSHRKPKRSPS